MSQASGERVKTYRVGLRAAAWHVILWSGIGFLLAILLAGCTFSRASTTEISSDAIHDDLTARLAEIQTAQVQALDLWDRLIAGEPVSCQDTIPVPPAMTLSRQQQAAHVQAAPVADNLNDAIRLVQESSDMWDNECSETRPWVPLSMARVGHDSAESASDALDRAAALLAAW